MRTWCRSQHARLQAGCHDLRFGRVLGWEWICFACDSILIIVARKLEFVALGFHTSLYPYFLVMFSHFKFGLDYVTCFRQWEKADTSRDLKFSCVSAFSLLILDAAIRTCLAEPPRGKERHVGKSQVVLFELITVNLPTDCTCLKEPSQNEPSLAQASRTTQPTYRPMKHNDH